MNKSKLAQATIRARRAVGNLGITLLAGNKCEIVNMNTNRILINNKTTAVDLTNKLTKYKHKWSVLLCVFGRDELGVEYIKTLDVAPKAACYSQDIHESISDKHAEMVQNFNDNHMCNLGWIAKPNPDDFDEEKVKELFTKLGAWDSYAPWELK